MRTLAPLQHTHLNLMPSCSIAMQSHKEHIELGPRLLLQVDAARAYPVVVDSAAMMPCSSSSVPSPLRLGPTCTPGVCQDMHNTHVQARILDKQAVLTVTQQSSIVAGVWGLAGCKARHLVAGACIRYSGEISSTAIASKQVSNEAVLVGNETHHWVESI